MARQLRVEYPGAIYHVMNRGDRREPICLDDRDRSRFVDTLGECAGKAGWLVHAYVLMPNHFHLVAETPRANLGGGMRCLLGTCTSRFNRRHRLDGHLFAGRYKSLVVDGSDSGYLREEIERRRAEEGESECRSVRRGWCLGDESFRRELLARMGERLDAEHDGAEQSETDADRAEGIVLAELNRRWWSEDDLGRRPNGDGGKVEIAGRLRAGTMRTAEWIAERLRMGSRAYLHHLLWRARKSGRDRTIK
jgi:REP element-mobilizing transposase RayT